MEGKGYRVREWGGEQDTLRGRGRERPIETERPQRQGWGRSTEAPRLAGFSTALETAGQRASFAHTALHTLHMRGVQIQ